MTDTTTTRRNPLYRGLAVVVLLICLGILGSLGTWQASRYLDRREIFAIKDVRQAMPVAEVTSASQLTEEYDYRNVTLRGGELLMESTAVVERRFHDHIAGNWTVTPYQFADGSVVVVHTGWVPENDTEHLSSPPATLTGIVITPGKVNLAEQARQDESFNLAELPRLGELDAEFLYEKLGKPGPPRVDTLVVLSGEGEPLVYPTPSHDHITKPYLTPGVHFGYAALWYGSALLMIWLFWAGWTGRLDPGAR